MCDVLSLGEVSERFAELGLPIMRHHTAWLTGAFCLMAATALAQAELVTAPPPNIVIGNYNSTSVGPYGGLEGSAYVARVGDPSAAWFNPAGLTREDSPQISGSAGVYQRTAVVPEALPNSGGSIRQLPNFVGFTFVPHANVTIGASLLSTNSWDQQTDAEVISDIPGGRQRIAYSADSSFELRNAALGVGYQGGGGWRYGAGLALSMMDLRLVQSASHRVAGPADLQSLLVESHGSASTMQFRAQGGVQYDRGVWRAGAAVRSPGLTIHRSGSVIFDGVLAAEPQSYGASLFDTDADVEYHLPWEFQGGAAYVGERFSFELNVAAWTPISAYSLLASDQPLLIYSDTATVPPSLSTRPFNGLTSASDGVVNVAAGGHYKVLENRDLRVHAGVGSNQSPAGSEDDVFNHVNLTAWSVGVSGSLGKFRFAAGLNHQSGTAHDVTVTNLLDGEQLRSPIRVRLAGFIYSLAYQF
jgi:hypothetical protein